MLLLILTLFACLTIVFFIAAHKVIDSDISDTYEGLAIAGTCITILALAVTFILGIAVSKLSVLDDIISMYEEENERIEEQIAITVKEYQEYETEIFTDVAPDSPITMVSIYPELKSDKLVQSQIDTYLENNKTIKQLKEEKLNGSVYRWWLYFDK